MKLLITGFEPFGGEAMNPSWEAVRLLPDEIAGAQIIKKQIPVAFDRGREVLAEEVSMHHPDMVLCVGQAGGAAAIAVERIGINLIDAWIADNDGKQPVDVPIREDGENAYFSTLPVKAMATRIRAAGVKAELSYSAGSYVCNTLLYEALYLADKFYPQMKAGFIHVPFVPEQTEGKPDTPSMELSDMVKGLLAAIEAAVGGQEIHVSMGTLQ